MAFFQFPMTDKNDLLAALDAAAVKLGRSRTSAEEVPGGVQPVDNIGTSRTSRDVLATGSATGSGQPIDAIYRIESLPALPIILKIISSCAHTRLRTWRAGESFRGFL